MSERKVKKKHMSFIFKNIIIDDLGIGEIEIGKDSLFLELTAEV